MRSLSRIVLFVSMIHLILYGLALAKDNNIVSSITEVKTEVVYISQVNPPVKTVWGRHWFAKILNSRQAPNCGAGLQICEVQDPTRLEAPWHGVAAPFPQCYDPALYVCSENFLCPLGAPKIEGQYACGPYTSNLPASESTPTSSSQPVPTDTSCGSGTLLCEVEDPTRLEAPWHGVSSPFPQCYDPALYICSENFLCPICAPKISGEYACGPYLPKCVSSPSSGLPTSSGFTTSALSSGSSTSLSSQSSIISGTNVNFTASTSPSSQSSIISGTNVNFTTSTSQTPSSSVISGTNVNFTFTSSTPSSISGTSTTNSFGNSTSLPTSLPTSSEEIVIGDSTFFLGSQPSTITDNGNTIVLGGSGGFSIVSESISLPTSGDTVITTDGLTISVHNPTSQPTAVSSGTGLSGSGSGTASASTASGTSIGSGTSTSSTPLSSSGSGTASTSTGSGISTSTTPPEVVIGGTTYSFPSLSTTITEPNGQSIILGPSGIVIGTDTLGFPSGTGPLAITTDGNTFTFDPASGSVSTSVPQTSVPEGVIIGGSSFSLPASQETLTLPDGTTIVLGPSGVVVGSDTISFPQVTAASTLTSDGFTFTLEPGGVVTSPSPQSTSLPDIVIGGSTFTPGGGFQTVTEPNGQSFVIGPSGIVVGSDTISFPQVTAASTITSDGFTFTLDPGGVSSMSSSQSYVAIDGFTFTLGSASQTVTEPNGETFIIGPSNIVVGSDTIALPSPGATVTTDGITFWDGLFPTLTSSSSSSSSTGPLPIFAAWPSDVSVSSETSGAITSGSSTVGTHILVTTSSSSPSSTGPPFVISIPKFPCLICGCWFCPPTIPGFDFFGLTGPGIYPPPPPGIRPPGFSIDFPSITIGNDGNPTYSSEPSSDRTTETTPCTTRTATECTATVSFGVNGAGSTTTSSTTSSCSTTEGCEATGVTTTTSTTSTCTVTSICATATACPTIFGRQVGSGCTTQSSCDTIGCGNINSYDIFPVIDTQTPQSDAAVQQSLSGLGIPSSAIFVSSSSFFGTVNYWTVQMTSDQMTSLQNDKTISVSIALSCIECYDPTTEEPALDKERFVNHSPSEEWNETMFEPRDSNLMKRDLGKEINAAPEMVFISVAPGSSAATYGTNYYYDDSAGENQIVYIIDTGADLSNSEFTNGQNVASRVQWIQCGEGNDGAEDDSSVYINPKTNTPGGKGHGTAMLTKVAGYLYGVAKKASPVLVRVPRVSYTTSTNENGDMLVSLKNPPVTAYLDGVSKVLDDWQRKQAAAQGSSPLNFKTATLLMSWYVPPADLPPGDAGTNFVGKLYQLLNKLVSLGVIPIAGSGNNGIRTTGITGYPALFGKTGQVSTIERMLVVGAVDNNGVIYTNSNDDSFVLIWAPGSSITVADAVDPGETYRGGASGTSVSAATVAGLAAYFWAYNSAKWANIGAVDQIELLGNEILSNAWDRNDPNNQQAPYKAIWNGVQPVDFAQPASCPILQKRQNGAEPSYEPCPKPIPTCTTSTVQECLSTEVITLGPAGNTIATTVTGSCSQTVGCSVTGFTSTSTSTTTAPLACTSVELFKQDFLDIFYCQCNDNTWNHWSPGGDVYSSCASQSATRTINVDTTPPASIPLSSCTGVVFGPDAPAFGVYFSTACQCGDYLLGTSGCPDSLAAPTTTLIYSAPSGYPGVTFTTDITAPICTDPVAKSAGIVCTPSPSSTPSVTPSPTSTPSTTPAPPSTRTTTLPDTTITIPLSAQCEHVFTDVTPYSTSICISSTSTNDLATPLPSGVWTCLDQGFTICYCGPEGLPCLEPGTF